MYLANERLHYLVISEVTTLMESTKYIRITHFTEHVKVCGPLHSGYLLTYNQRLVTISILPKLTNKLTDHEKSVNFRTVYYAKNEKKI